MSSTAALLFLLLQVTPAQQSNGSPGADPSATAKTEPADADSSDELPVSLSRIQRALSTPPQLKLIEPTMRNGRPVFRVDIEGAKIDMQTLLSKEALRGAVPYGGMTHQEFLDLVTPDDVRGYAAFSNAQGITVAATSIALQWAVLKAIDVFKKAKDAHEQEVARKEVEEALEALKKARRAAGLADK
ncbi:MAG: hypothetical protein ABW292_24280 [Vicinamibacterales bacterium]